MAPGSRSGLRGAVLCHMWSVDGVTAPAVPDRTQRCTGAVILSEIVGAVVLTGAPGPADAADALMGDMVRDLID